MDKHLVDAMDYAESSLNGNKEGKEAVRVMETIRVAIVEAKYAQEQS